MAVSHNARARATSCTEDSTPTLSERVRRSAEYRSQLKEAEAQYREMGYVLDDDDWYV